MVHTEVDMNDEVDTIAFENFFHDYVVNVTHDSPEWGREYWEPWGFDVVNSQIEFKTPEYRTLFLLRWL